MLTSQMRSAVFSVPGDGYDVMTDLARKANLAGFRTKLDDQGSSLTLAGKNSRIKVTRSFNQAISVSADATYAWPIRFFILGACLFLVGLTLSRGMDGWGER